MNVQGILRSCGVTEFTIVGNSIIIHDILEFSNKDNLLSLEKLKYNIVCTQSISVLLRNLVKAKSVNSYLEKDLVVPHLACSQMFSVKSYNRNLEIGELTARECYIDSINLKNSIIKISDFIKLDNCEVTHSKIYSNSVFFQEKYMGFGTSDSVLKDLDVYTKFCAIDTGVLVEDLRVYNCDLVYSRSRRVGANKVKLTNCKSLYLPIDSRFIVEFDSLDELYLGIPSSENRFSGLSDEEMIKAYNEITKGVDTKFVGLVKKLYVYLGPLKHSKDLAEKLFNSINYTEIEVLSKKEFFASVSKFKEICNI